MAESGDIFRKRRLTPNQLRAVAEHRGGDAWCLFESGQNARMVGAIYIGGFVIECLLKALLLERHPNLQRPVDPARLASADRDVHALLYNHELDEMLLFLPEVEKKLRSIGPGRRGSPWEGFRGICAEWSVYARYSPKQAKPEDARRFLETVDEVKQWLREL